jgi:hypothetical protein
MLKSKGYRSGTTKAKDWARLRQLLSAALHVAWLYQLCCYLRRMRNSLLWQMDGKGVSALTLNDAGVAKYIS